MAASETDYSAGGVLPEEISSAFKEFNEQSLLLTRAYEALKLDISRINLELEEKNRVLNEKNIELDAARDFLDSLFRGMGEGLLVISESGKIIMINNRAAQILGVDLTLTGSQIKDVSELKFIIPFLSDNQISDFSNKAFKVEKNEKILWLEVSLNRINNGREILLVFKDLTEVKDLRAQVARSAELADLGQMAVTVAHEIRNPLGGIEGFASLLKRDLVDEPDKLRLIDRIISGVQNLNSFVGGLLSFSRKLDFSPSEFNIAELVKRTLMYAGKFDENDKYPDIIINLKVAGDLIWYTDSGLMQKLLLNLILNSFQIIDMNKGNIEIKVSLLKSCDAVAEKCIYSYQSMDFKPGRPFLSISVKDTGPGIAKDDIEKIFKPFYTTKNFGTGIGLSMVLKIIETIGGRLDLFSDKGSGAEFIVYFPEADNNFTEEPSL